MQNKATKNSNSWAYGQLPGAKGKTEPLCVISEANPGTKQRLARRDNAVFLPRIVVCREKTWIMFLVLGSAKISNKSWKK